MDTDPRRPASPPRALSALAAYQLATGVLPFVSRRLFEGVTGRKREWWLVQSVGAMLTVVGGTALWAARRDRVTPELEIVVAGCAASLVAVDVVYAARRRISPVYLADATVQAALVSRLARERAGR